MIERLLSEWRKRKAIRVAAVALIVCYVFFVAIRWLLPMRVIELEGHTAAVHGIAIMQTTGDGTLVATACADKKLRFWSTDGKLHRTIMGHSRRLVSIAACESRQEVATGSADWEIKIWAVPSGIEKQTLRGHRETVVGLAYTPDGSRLLEKNVTGVVCGRVERHGLRHTMRPPGRPRKRTKPVTAK